MTEDLKKLPKEEIEKTKEVPTTIFKLQLSFPDHKWCLVMNAELTICTVVNTPEKFVPFFQGGGIYSICAR